MNVLETWEEKCAELMARLKAEKATNKDLREKIEELRQQNIRLGIDNSRFKHASLAEQIMRDALWRLDGLRGRE
jgi:hypothetical protein